MPNIPDVPDFPDTPVISEVEKPEVDVIESNPEPDIDPEEIPTNPIEEMEINTDLSVRSNWLIEIYTFIQLYT